MLELFHKYKDSKGKQAKLKSPAQLQARLALRSRGPHPFAARFCCNLGCWRGERP
jgi:hypothetical protein